MIWQLLFWAIVALIGYVYFGYPAVLWVLCRLKNEQLVPVGDGFEPTVSLIIAAYNEEQVIGQKLENSLALDYPRDKLEIIVVSDGSTDETAEIARVYTAKGVQLLDLLHNVGKASAQNEGVKRATGDILVFTDAEAFLEVDAVSQLVRWFGSSEVGCITGRIAYTNEFDAGVSQGESIYWRYEVLLREMESVLGSLAMGSGAIFAIRRELFRPLDPNVSEDFVLPMQAALKGFKTVYELSATSRIRLGQTTPETMFSTKVRTITLDMRGLFLCQAILNAFRYPLYAWALISHKLLRWLVPYFLIALFAINALLLGQPFYRLTLALQIAFYSLAFAGYWFQRKGKPPRILGIPFSFCLVNGAALLGIVRFSVGQKAGRWNPVR